MTPFLSLMIRYLLSVVLAVLISFLFRIVYTRILLHRRRKELGYKGPSVSSFWLGNLSDIGRYSEANGNKSFACHEVWKKQFGDVYAYFVGSRLEVAVHDVEMVKEILVKQFSHFTDRMGFLLEETSEQKYSIINLKGQAWKDIRSLITPVFSSAKLKGISAIVQEKTDKFIENVRTSSSGGGSFDIYQLCQQLTTDVIGKAAFAINTKCQEDPNDFFLRETQALFRALDFLASPVMLLAMVLPELDNLLAFVCGPFMEVTKRETALFGALKKVLEERKKTYKQQKSVDILQLLLMQQSSNEAEKSTVIKDGMVVKKNKLSLNDNDILANAYIFLLAGFETTSTALGLSIWLLAKHRDVQRRLQEEIDELVKEGVPTYEQAMDMPYLDAVFHECLRFYPPVTGFVVRTCVSECTVNGHRFQPGMQVFIPTYSIHHNPELWPEPERFDPERFTGERTHHSMAWQPFGSGPRNCIGLRFAEMEYKMALIKLFARYDISLGQDSQDPLITEAKTFIHRPDNGVVVYAKLRDK